MKRFQNSWRAKLAIPKEERHPILDTGQKSMSPYFSLVASPESRCLDTDSQFDRIRHFWTLLDTFLGVLPGNPVSPPRRLCLTHKSPLIPGNNFKTLGGPNSLSPRKNVTPLLDTGQRSTGPYLPPVAAPESCRFDMVSQWERIRHFWTLLDTFLDCPSRQPCLPTAPPVSHSLVTAHPWQQFQTLRGPNSSSPRKNVTPYSIRG